MAAKVKAYDRASFRQWRTETKARGQYEKTMAPIISGYEGVTPKRPRTNNLCDFEMLGRISDLSIVGRIGNPSYEY